MQGIISIIIPVYNAEKYIPQCLDSILSQSFKEWECLLIDDGSIDESLQICKSYALKDQRFKTFHKDNGGVSTARNYGLSKAIGQWIYFCDADDEIMPDGLSLLAKYASNSHAVMIAGGYFLHNEKNEINKYPLKKAFQQYDMNQFLSVLFDDSFYGYQGYLWCKLFKSDIIRSHNLKFDESISFNEDRLFITEYLCRSRGSTFFFSEPIYKYYLRQGGAMLSVKNSFNRKFLTDFEAFLKIEKIIVDGKCTHGVVRNVRRCTAQSYINIVKMMREHHSTEIEVRQWLKKEIYSRHLMPIVCMVYIQEKYKILIWRVKGKIKKIWHNTIT